ncbi:MAG: DUF4382 domain-containing protein [Candidatus Aenigmarchaeota archaeon]|nr:DUF4382 domain-containing protein [Candidatus Aenigmarchaeota archaeon]
METKNALLLLALVAVVFVAGCTTYTSGSATGRAVFTATDAAADMGTISSVQVTIDEIKVHSASKGWVTVSSTPRTVDLLELKAESKNELLADANLAADAYSQMRFEVSKVMVTDASGTYEAKLPSNEVKFSGTLVVEANKTATATFDFLADESLHITSRGSGSAGTKYVMAPVIQVTTRSNADVRLESDNEVQVSGGAVNTNEKIGMDINGNVGVGLKIPANVVLDVNGGVISVISAEGRGVFAVTDAAANMGSVSKVEVTIREVQVHSASQGWVTVSTTPKTVDLLELKTENRNELLADTNLVADTYNQVRLEVEKVVVTDQDGEHEAKLPSNELKIVGNFVVEANKTTATVFDFMANESLHTTSGANKQYIMAPVIKITSATDAQVDAESNSDVKIAGGSVKTDTTVGMDVKGNVGAGLRIPSSAMLQIIGNIAVIV